MPLLCILRNLPHPNTVVHGICLQVKDKVYNNLAPLDNRKLCVTYTLWHRLEVVRRGEHGGVSGGYVRERVVMRGLQFPEKEEGTERKRTRGRERFR